MLLSMMSTILFSNLNICMIHCANGLSQIKQFKIQNSQHSDSMDIQRFSDVSYVFRSGNTLDSDAKSLSHIFMAVVMSVQPNKCPKLIIHHVIVKLADGWENYSYTCPIFDINMVLCCKELLYKILDVLRSPIESNRWNIRPHSIILMKFLTSKHSLQNSSTLLVS